MRECGTASTERATCGMNDILAFMQTLFPLAAITDEFSPDLEIACRSMAELGMTGGELRMVLGKNILDLTDAEPRRHVPGVVQALEREMVRAVDLLREADREDCGQAAARRHLKSGLGDLAAQFLGPGEWSPKREGSGADPALSAGPA